MRIANPVPDGVPVSLFAFDCQQRFQVSDVTVILLHRLLRQREELAAMAGTRTALQYCRTLACSRLSVWPLIECLPAISSAADRNQPSSASAVRTEPILPTARIAANITGYTSTVSTSFPAFTTSYTTRGNVTGVSRYVSSGNWVNTSATYDIAGNVLASIDGNQNQTRYSYSDNWGATGAAWGGSGPSQGQTYAFPTTIINALAQQTTIAYGYNAGRPATVQDPNLVTTSFDYTDPLQRLKSVTYPLGATTTYAYSDTPGSVTVTEARSVRAACSTSPASLQSETIYDGLGRPASTKTLGPNGWISIDQTYDAFGRSYQASNPYESGSPVYTTTAYDALDRVLTVTTPDGAVTQSAYGAFSDSTGFYAQTAITDPANTLRTSYNDGLGRLVRVLAQGPATVNGQSYTPADYTTNYVYDVLDNLTQVNTSQSSRNRSFTYDGLSRLTAATNPENGTVQYSSYDGNGNLKSKIANGITTSSTYDPLNRLTQKSYNDGKTPTVNYTYDAYTGDPNPIGRLTEVATLALNSQPATTVSYTQHDALGRVTASSQQLGTGPVYSFAYTYNDVGLDTVTYPSQRKVENCYDAAGRIQTLENLTQTNLPNYASSVQYAPFGGVSQATFGNGMLETRSYNVRQQVTQIQAANLLTLGYNYGSTNNNGNVLSQTITRGSQVWTQNYGYSDGLNRLTSAQESGAGAWSQVYDYDPFANRWLDTSSSGVPLSPFTPRRSRKLPACTAAYMFCCCGTIPAALLALGIAARNRVQSVSLGFNGE